MNLLNSISGMSTTILPLTFSSMRSSQMDLQAACVELNVTWNGNIFDGSYLDSYNARYNRAYSVQNSVSESSDSFCEILNS